MVTTWRFFYPLTDDYRLLKKATVGHKNTLNRALRDNAWRVAHVEETPLDQ
jgi:hypothetical protein